MHLPANTFSSRHESCGEDTSTTRGTALTASASANVKGSWVTLKAATSFSYEAITVHFGNATGIASHMVDIGIDDGAGNVFIIVPDLHWTSWGTAATIESFFDVTIPVHVPAGSKIVARDAYSGGAANPIYVLVVGHEFGLGGAPGYSRAINLYTPALSRGVTIDPGAVANTKGSWTELTSASDEAVAAIFGSIGSGGDISRAAASSMLLDIGIGSGGAEFVVVPNLLIRWGPSADVPLNVILPPVSCQAPSGTRFAARSQAGINTAGDRLVDLCLYGLVA